MATSEFTAAEKDEFRRIALAHTKSLDPREFGECRLQAACHPSSVDGVAYDPAISVENLIDQSLHESDIHFQHLQHYKCQMKEIGRLSSGATISYISRSGIFVCAPQDRSSSLMIWLSHPAYPWRW